MSHSRKTSLRFFIDADEDGNFRLIPEHMRTKWMAWVAEIEGRMNTPTHLDWKPLPPPRGTRVIRNIEKLTFTDPVIL